jgi:hypothetical protein
MASLRFNRPKPLEIWLKSIGATNPGRIVDDQRLVYYGELSEDDLRQFDLEHSADIEIEDEEIEMVCEDDLEPVQPMILLELEPGRTVVASLNQILYMGEPLQLGGKNRGDSGLYTGDTVSAFKIEQQSEDESIRINILRSVPDIRYQVENFTRQRGIMFGEVILDAENKIYLKHLYGADRSGQKPHRTGLWNPRIEPPTEAQLSIVRDLRPGEYVYLKFVKADDKTGILWFQILTPEEVFERKNLVYVKPLDVGGYGDSFKLNAQPLVQLEEGDYFIPDTQYSQRSGALRTYRKSDLGHICMASVYERGEYRGKPSTKLSLTEAPPRRFTYLMTNPDWRGYVTQVSKNGFILELSPGSCAYIPFDDALLNDSEKLRLKKGAVVLLNRKQREWKVKIRDVLHSHLDYLPTKPGHYFFTTLWAKKVKRREWFDKNGKVNCSIIGYPQLSGLGKIQESDLFSSAPLPLAFQKLSNDRKWVELEHSINRDWPIGKLKIGEDDNSAELLTWNNERLKIHWMHVSFFLGSYGECRKHLESWGWRDSNDIKERWKTIRNAQVIARCSGNQTSLTEFATLPCPVDHLIEQYGNVSSRWFIVACAEAEHLILEVAPGRYAELPTVLLEPLHDRGQLRDGLILNWMWLKAGDKIQLTMLTPLRSRDVEILPNFRVMGVIPGFRHNMNSTPLVTVHVTLSGGNRIIGLDGPDSIPVDILPFFPADDVLYNLKEIDKPFHRYQEVKHQFSKFNSRLVLHGRVGKILKQDKVTIVFLNIGIIVPRSGDGRSSDPVLFLKPNDTSVRQGDEIHVRVINVEFDKQKLITFEYKVERLPDPDTLQIVRMIDGKLFSYRGLPKHGDSVFIHRPDPQEPSVLRVVGFNTLSIKWVYDKYDPLNLHNPNEIQQIIELLLVCPSQMLAATVEKVDERKATFTLSRKNQLERIRMDPTQVLRGQVTHVLSQNRLIVDILGVPVTMRTDDFCQSGPWLKPFADEINNFAQKGGLEIEVIWQTPGSISCSNLYQVPGSLPGEFDATIELVGDVGLTVMNAGIRYFVFQKELSWCRLDASLMRKLFHHGNQITVRATEASKTVGNNVFKYIKTSHISTYDIRSEITQILHNRHDPVYVNVMAIDQNHNKNVVVRGQSGALMELPMQFQSDISEGERLTAYVHNINMTRRIAILSVEDHPLEQLNLPVIPEQYAADLMSMEPIKACLEELRAAIDSNEPSDIVNWLQNQSMLEPGTRTVRCILETLHEARLGSADWWQVLISQATGESSFLSLWRGFSQALIGYTDLESLNPEIKFALGYQALLNEKNIKEASDLLTPLADHPTWSNYFDVHLCLARIDRLKDDSFAMTRRLKTVLERLLSNALRTIVPPLVAPVLQPESMRELSQALADGQKSEINRIANIGQRQAPGSPQVLSLQIWRKIAYGKRDDSIIQLIERLLHNINAEHEASGFDFDPRLSLWAAWLCFAYGRIADGWLYLEEMERLIAPQEFGIIDESLELACVWYAWLSNRPLPANVDVLHGLLFKLFQQSRWRTHCDIKLFDSFWEHFRTSLMRWTLDIPTCQSVSEPNMNSLESLTEWCELNNCQKLKQSLSIEISIESK